MSYMRHKNINYMQHFLIQITASSLYCLREHAENHKSDRQAPN